MRIRAAVSAALASAGILLAGWQSGAHVADPGNAAAGTAAGMSSGTSSGSGGTTAGAAAQVSETFAGSVVQTRFGAAAVIKAQSAQVQTISGATVTSDAYLSSLQGALDAANL